MISLERLLAIGTLVSSLGFSTPALAQSIWIPHKPSDTSKGFVEPKDDTSQRIPKIDEIVKVVSEVPTHKQTMHLIYRFFSDGYPTVMEREEDRIVTEKEIQFFLDETEGRDILIAMIYWPQQSAPYTDRITDYTFLKRWRDEEYIKRCERSPGVRQIYMRSENIFVDEETVKKRIESIVEYGPARIGYVKIWIREAREDPTKSVKVVEVFEPIYDGYTPFESETKISFERYEIEEIKHKILKNWTRRFR